MTAPKRVLWLGPVFDDATLLGERPVSAAANRWQLGMISALRDHGVEVFVLSHIPDRIWPRGSWIVRAEEGGIARGLLGEIVTYCNMPGLRQASLCVGYSVAALRNAVADTSPDMVISYNTSRWNAVTGLLLQNFLRIPWVCISADVPPKGIGHLEHRLLAEKAAGRVALSWGLFESTAKPALHLDGGIKRLRFDPAEEIAATEKRIVVYTGSVVDYAGTDFLVDGFRRVVGDDVELWICGRGSDPDLRSPTRDPRIHFFGMVSEADLERICRAATLFVNPRPSWIECHTMDFPSKVLEYLSFGKPVISTWTKGLSPDYADVLVVLREDVPDCLAATIREVVNWSPARRRHYAACAAAFLEPRKLWSSQGVAFLDWVAQEALTK
jgi:glycosyltransferase involved in cell wall biosynthesis